MNSSNPKKVAQNGVFSQHKFAKIGFSVITENPKDCKSTEHKFGLEHKHTEHLRASTSSEHLHASTSSEHLCANTSREHNRKSNSIIDPLNMNLRSAEHDNIFESNSPKNEFNSSKNDFYNINSRERIYKLKFKDPTHSFGLVPYSIDRQKLRNINDLHFNETNNPLNLSLKDDKNDNDAILFLLQQRADTFEYADLLLTTWTTEDQLAPIFTLISEEERTRVREYIFDELYNDMLVDTSSKLFKEAYNRSKKKYESIKHLIPNILDTTRTFTQEPPWGFPKGRKNSYEESEIDCAIRETEEETRIPKIDYNVHRPINFMKNFKEQMEIFMLPHIIWLKLIIKLFQNQF